MKYVIMFLGWADVVLFAVLIVIYFWYRFKLHEKVKNTFLWDIYDIGIAFVKYIMLHHWFKIDERQMHFITTAGWKDGSEIRERMYKWMKHLNKLK